MVKNLPAMQETQVRSWVRKIPWRPEWQPSLVFLPGEFCGQRSLAGDGPWGCKESDLTEQLIFTFTFKTNTNLWEYMIQEFDTVGCCIVREEGISFRSLEGNYINTLYLREALEVQIQTFN